LNENIVDIIEKFGLSQSYIRGYNYYGANSSSGLGQYNKDAFLKIRSEFNKEKTRIDLLLVLVLYSFNNQIRFNSTGSFNLPVGKRDYNGSSRKNVAAFNQISNEKKIVFRNCDFRDIDKMLLTKDDFLYLDPPYLLGLASYNEMGGWIEKDENDLYELLTKLDKKGIKFALSNVLEHKGKTNQIMKDWVNKNKYKLHKIDYDYKNSNYHSTAKDSKTIEALITNY
jgi:DNA adenine methylase Dam